MHSIKKFMYSTAAAAAAFAGWQVSKVISNQRRETVPYSTILKEGNFAIRFYPPRITAAVVIKGHYNEVARKGMTKLLKYLNGHNEMEQPLKVIKPFTLAYDNSLHLGTVTVAMPKAYSIDKLPRPESDDIKIFTTGGEYKAVLCFNGISSGEEFDKHTGELVEIMEMKGFNYHDKIEHLYYNDPLQLVARRNEVHLTIENFE